METAVRPYETEERTVRVSETEEEATATPGPFSPEGTAPASDLLDDPTQGFNAGPTGLFATISAGKTQLFTDPENPARALFKSGVNDVARWSPFFNVENDYKRIALEVALAIMRHFTDGADGLAADLKDFKESVASLEFSIDPIIQPEEGSQPPVDGPDTSSESLALAEDAASETDGEPDQMELPF